MVSIPAPTTSLSTHFLQNSQTILTSSKKISLRNQRKLQFKHSLSISCGVTRIVNRIEFSAWKSLPTPHPAACPTKHARLTQRMHVGQVSENAAETNTYSVWAIPPKDTTEKLKKLMENLRSEYGGPEFEPHFTVVGPNEKTESDAINMFNSACQGVKPYTATVDSVVQGPSYYESVYCLLQPSKELLETAAHCSKYFGHDIPNGFSGSTFLLIKLMYCGRIFDRKLNHELFRS
ncbi:Cyclic phosphodiesterase [Thalictrum thalictroides]|uniref:Cyclic phosphodiesterase n=1 Tax=Thalictrum thalictroides TaxID=46969 RepID=A0A7J6WC92_THATH|nr:Cyclic phosphodiesterase [Thalictrum thalictroides]